MSIGECQRHNLDVIFAPVKSGVLPDPLGIGPVWFEGDDLATEAGGEHGIKAVIGSHIPEHISFMQAVRQISQAFVLGLKGLDQMEGLRGGLNMEEESGFANPQALLSADCGEHGDRSSIGEPEGLPGEAAKPFLLENLSRFREFVPHPVPSQIAHCLLGLPPTRKAFWPAEAGRWLKASGDRIHSTLTPAGGRRPVRSNSSDTFNPPRQDPGEAGLGVKARAGLFLPDLRSIRSLEESGAIFNHSKPCLLQPCF